MRHHPAISKEDRCVVRKKTLSCRYEVVFWLPGDKKRFECETSRPILAPEDVELMSATLMGAELSHLIPEFRMLSEKPTESYDRIPFRVVSFDKAPGTAPAQVISDALEGSAEIEMEREWKMRSARQHLSGFRRHFILGAIGLSRFNPRSILRFAPKDVMGELERELDEILLQLFWVCLACTLAAPLVPLALFLLGAVGGGGTLSLLYGLLILFSYATIQVVRSILALEHLQTENKLKELEGVRG